MPPSLFREPPYLRPARALTASVNDWLLSSFEGEAVQELGGVLAVLRAASIVHQAHHWQTRGSSFYGDHQLFDRLYSEGLEGIDQVAERAVGLGGRELVGAARQSTLVADLIARWTSMSGDSSAAGLAGISLGVERDVVSAVTEAKRSLEASGRLTEGTDNLLQGIADQHEEFVYLLQQRLGADGYSYDAR